MPITGVSVARILTHVAVHPGELPDVAAIELLGGVVRAVAAFHQGDGAPSHGAVRAQHVAVAPDGSILLSGRGVAQELQPLQLNRERLWREFGLALPAAASLPRFDQRADITQVGVLGVALLLRRPLAATEYPRPIGDLVLQATSASTPEQPGDPRVASALRMWLQQAIQLNARGNFTAAVDAAQAYAELPLPVGARRAGAQGIRALVERLSSGTFALSEAVA